MNRREFYMFPPTKGKTTAISDYFIQQLKTKSIFKKKKRLFKNKTANF